MMVLISEYNEAVTKHNEILKEYNNLIARINKKGGEAFLNQTVIPNNDHEAEEKTSLSDGQLKKLISFCHPDRHDGNKLSVELTQMLLAIKEERNGK